MSDIQALINIIPIWPISLVKSRGFDFVNVDGVDDAVKRMGCEIQDIDLSP